MIKFLYLNFIKFKLWLSSLTIIKVYFGIIYTFYALASIMVIYSFIKLAITFPGWSTVFVPTPFENSLPLTDEALGPDWRRRYIPYLPESINIPAGGILTVRNELGPMYGNGIEIILPGASHLDQHLYAVEMTRTQLISYANIRRMPCTDELAGYWVNPDYFRIRNNSEDAFCFIYTYMSDHAPDQILTDAVGRTYFIMDDPTIIRFTCDYYHRGWKAYDLVMLFNHIDSTRYGMVCRTREIAEHVIAQNNKLFEESYAEFHLGLRECAEWSLGWSIIFGSFLILSAVKVYWPMPLPIVG